MQGGNIFFQSPSMFLRVSLASALTAVSSKLTELRVSRVFLIKPLIWFSISLFSIYMTGPLIFQSFSLRKVPQSPTTRSIVGSRPMYTLPALMQAFLFLRALAPSSKGTMQYISLSDSSLVLNLRIRCLQLSQSPYGMWQFSGLVSMNTASILLTRSMSLALDYRLTSRRLSLSLSTIFSISRNLGWWVLSWQQSMRQMKCEMMFWRQVSMLCLSPMRSSQNSFSSWEWVSWGRASIQPSLVCSCWICSSRSDSSSWKRKMRQVLQRIISQRVGSSGRGWVQMRELRGSYCKPYIPANLLYTMAHTTYQFQRYSVMGGCCSDRYNYLKQQHGTSIRQLVVSAKNMQFVHKTVDKISQHVVEYAQGKQEEQLRVVQQRETMSQQTLQKAIAQVEKREGVAKLEEARGHKIEDLLGYSFALQQYEQLKGDICETYSTQRKSILEELGQIEVTEEENCGGLDWEDIPEVKTDEQSEVIRRGQLQCTQNILDYQTYFLHQYATQLSKQHWQSSIGLIKTCESTADALHVMARDKMTTSLNLLLGNNLDNYILLK